MNERGPVQLRSSTPAAVTGTRHTSQAQTLWFGSSNLPGGTTRFSPTAGGNRFKNDTVLVRIQEAGPTARSSNGRIAGFEPADVGPNPTLAA